MKVTSGAVIGSSALSVPPQSIVECAIVLKIIIKMRTESNIFFGHNDSY